MWVGAVVVRSRRTDEENSEEKSWFTLQHLLESRAAGKVATNVAKCVGLKRKNFEHDTTSLVVTKRLFSSGCVAHYRKRPNLEAGIV